MLSIISVSCDTHSGGHQTCGWLGKCHQAVWQVTVDGSGTGNQTPGRLCFLGEQHSLLSSDAPSLQAPAALQGFGCELSCGCRARAGEPRGAKLS